MAPASNAGNDSRALGAAPRVGAGAQLEVSAAAEMINIVQANHIVKITAALWKTMSFVAFSMELDIQYYSIMLSVLWYNTYLYIVISVLIAAKYPSIVA